MAREVHMARADEKNPQRGSRMKFKPLATAVDPAPEAPGDGEPVEPTDKDLGLAPVAPAKAPRKSTKKK